MVGPDGEPTAEADGDAGGVYELPKERGYSGDAGQERQSGNPGQEAFAGSPGKQQPQQGEDSKDDPWGQNDANQNAMKKNHCRRAPTVFRGV